MVPRKSCLKQTNYVLGELFCFNPDPNKRYSYEANEAYFLPARLFDGMSTTLAFAVF